MKVLNRNIAPDSKSIDKINLIKATEIDYKNKVKLYAINAGEQSVKKIDFIFNAGTWYEKQRLVSLITNLMLNEGTKTKNSNKIADLFEFYGATFNVSISPDTAYISVMFLGKHIEKILIILDDILRNSDFPQNELDNLVQNKKQQYLLDSSKVKVLARRKFNETLFGKEHPYSMYSEYSDFDLINTNVLKSFYSDFYSSSNCKIVLSGSVTEADIKLIEKYFGNHTWGSNKKIETIKYNIKSSDLKEHLIEKPDTVQSAVRIGTTMINRRSPDFYGLSILNTVLGGYFGSRLMANIREDKGYTYGIGSIAVPYKHAGYFVIVTEVGSDVCQKAIDEVYFELKRLQDELIPENELSLVKNYMLGEMVRAFDGPFSIAESYRELIDYDLEMSYYQDFLDSIKNATSVQLKELAYKYFNRENMFEVVVGKKS